MRHPQNQTKLIGVINILYLSQNQEKNLVSHHFWGPQSIKMKIAPALWLKKTQGGGITY